MVHRSGNGDSFEFFHQHIGEGYLKGQANKASHKQFTIKPVPDHDMAQYTIKYQL